MGICSSQMMRSSSRRSGGAMECAPTAMVINSDGGLQELRQPTKASYILSQNPKCFLCSSETMFVGSYAPQMRDDEELKLGQIYFLMPVSKSRAPLSLQDLCSLAVKASKGLNNSVPMGHETTDQSTSPFFVKSSVRFPDRLLSTGVLG